MVHIYIIETIPISINMFYVCFLFSIKTCLNSSCSSVFVGEAP